MVFAHEGIERQTIRQEATMRFVANFPFGPILGGLATALAYAGAAVLVTIALAG